MPLVRVEVRNEYGLGMPELYTETNREDPKAVLDGVAVAGLVGILRQLGDLAEFAAEVFHGLQEQVLITSSRSHKLVERVHNIEAALPPLEKAILAQRTHLHFAYTAGSHWHTRIRAEQNHFIYSDLPRCIMDAYEDCRDPPRLHKLDKYDIGGPGSCFRRYSDPTYFKRSSSGPYGTHLQNVPREKKARRNKKKKSSSRYKDVTHDAPINMHVGRTDFGSTHFEEKASPSENISPFHVPESSRIEPEIDQLTTFESQNGSGYIECIFRPSYSTQSEDNNIKETNSDYHHNSSYPDSPSIYVNNGVQDENINSSYTPENSSSRSPYITWDEKLEIIDSTSRPSENLNLNTEIKTEPVRTSIGTRGQPDEIESETDYYLDALNTIESESETDLDCQTKRELKQSTNTKNEDDTSENFEFHVPEQTSSSKSVKSHIEHHVSSNYEDVNRVIEVDRVENGGQTNSISIASTIESEEVETAVTNPATVESDEIETPDTNVATVKSEKVKTPAKNHETVQFPSSTIEPSPVTSGGQSAVNQPVMFWTNGGLLGLEPSKPPDFGIPTPPIEETKTSETPKNTINEETPINTSKSDDNNINSSRIFEFSNRLLVNGFRRQISLVGNETLANSVKSDVPENTRIQNQKPTVTGIPFREQFGNANSFISPSSPPLEHMRISFQPIDGFETSKLKLSFPDSSNNNSDTNGYGHMFPSFQLIPEVGIHNSGSGSDSDSDDDTFCRSSPYASDDGNSQGSESNSDQWDSGDSPGMKGRELDDAFGRVSSAESASSSLMNGIRIPEFQNFDSMNAMNGLHNKVNELSLGKEQTPPPPPLPPMEWRGVKEDGVSNELTLGLTLTPQQPRPPPMKQDSFVEKVDFMPKPKQPDWQNLHVQNEFNRATNGKKVDEKEDFLQQIRAKSRNLRRTSTAPPTVSPPGPTGVKVTAILEKANAIRQAVGSDDGEDNWSDT